MTAEAGIAGAIGIAACVDDLRRRRIANWIPVSALVSGLALQSIEHGWKGAGSAVLGTFAGAAVFLIFYLLGGMGGGDVKLMAGFGALLGAKRLVVAALWTAGCGGILALIVIAAETIREACAARSADLAGEPVRRPRRESIPYAPAIAAGVWLSLLGTT